MNIKWDAEKYTSNFSFVHKYGNSVTELIEAPEGSRVLDLGCGNGALTGVLKDQGFQVTGLDDSKDLLSVAKKYFPDLEFIHADATDFSLKEQVDVVFSNAVFHWIDREKQPDMLRCVYKALKGRLRNRDIPIRFPSTSRPSANTLPFWSRLALRCAMRCFLTE